MAEPLPRELLLLLLLLILAVFVLFFELLRIFCIRRYRYQTLKCQGIPAPLYSLACLGSHASINRLIFGSRDEVIAHNRALLADAHNGLYMSYSWCYADLRQRCCFGRAWLIVTDPRVARLILENTDDAWAKPQVQGIVTAIIGQSCTQARGPDALRQRAILATSFRNRAALNAVIDGASERFLQCIEEAMVGGGEEEGIELDVLPYITQLAIDLVMAMVFGDPSQTHGLGELKSAYLAYWKHLRINAAFHLTAKEQAERNMFLQERVVDLYARLLKLLLARKQLLKEEAQDGTLNSCIVDRLIPLTTFSSPTSSSSSSSAPSIDGSQGQGGKLSEEECVHNCYSLLTAGFETSAHTIAVALYNAAKEGICIDEAAAQERHGVEPKLVVKALVKESLRLYPPVLSVVRECVKATSLGVNNLTCCKGARVQVDILGTHYSRALWGNKAHEFDLSRWLPLSSDKSLGVQGEDVSEGASAITKRIFIPFGYGKKSCIGQALALAASESCVFAFLNRFVARKSNDVTFKLRFTQTPTMRMDAVKIKICKRTPANSAI